MMIEWVVDYEALSAWSTLAAAIATFAAIVVALLQSARSRADLHRQLEHQNWLEQKRIEEEHLGRLLDVVDHPYEVAQEFYFSMHRLLAPLVLGLPTAPGFDDEVRRALDGFAARTKDTEKLVGSFLNIMMALREYHQQWGDTEASNEYTTLLSEVQVALNSGGELREWLANPELVISISPDSFFDLPQVQHARETAYAAARSIARRLVRLYARPASS